MRHALVFVVAALCSLVASLAAQVDRDGPRISPFRGMRQVDGGIEVQVLDDTWYELQSVAGIETGTLLAEAKRLCGDRAWKRISEDLPALLDAMEHPTERVVDVRVRSLTTGEVTELEAVEMTTANRRRLVDANNRRPGGKLPVLADVFARSLTADQVRQDLAVLGKLLDTRFAYRDLRGVDLEALLREVGDELGSAPPRLRFAEAVDRILRAFGDGHSRINETIHANDLWLPCLVQRVEGGYVAFEADRSALLDAERPFLVAIDDVPLARWLAAAGEFATQGSPTMVDRETERGLRRLGELRRALGLPGKPAVRLTLRGAAGDRAVTTEVVARKPVYGIWPHQATRLLDGNIGYLRIERMRDEPEFLDELDLAMQGFRKTEGLVIDVRGNPGGHRDALRRLAPYFLPADGTAIVGNVAAMLAEGKQPPPPDALADRFLYRADWNGWNDAQRAAIGTFLKGFEPSWQLPRGRFSPWNFLVLDRSDNDKAFHYDRSVVVLIDRNCFSATDVFAAAMQAIPGVTLVGETSCGGSGRAQPYQLPNSEVRLQLSSMASFRPDGVLFEGNGVEPDVAVATQPGDLIGATDTALNRGLELLR